MYMYFINRKLQCIKNVTSNQIDLKINAKKKNQCNFN